MERRFAEEELEEGIFTGGLCTVPIYKEPHTIDKKKRNPVPLFLFLHTDDAEE